MVTPQIKSTSKFTIQVTRLLWAGHKASQKKVYCEWEVVHSTGRVASCKTETTADSGQEIVFVSEPVELDGVSSTTMLSECTVKIYVKQPHRFLCLLRDKEIGCGEEKLKRHVGVDCSTIKIELTGKN
eukprot:jgi/Phyca11/544700/estExt2_Genewise1Plus.C_PHYCAscaffold_150444